MHYAYIIGLSDNTYYKGLTDNIDRRLWQHEKGQVKATKNKLPFRLVHVELSNTRINARMMEKYFKSGFGRELIKELDKQL